MDDTTGLTIIIFGLTFVGFIMAGVVNCPEHPDCPDCPDQKIYSEKLKANVTGVYFPDDVICINMHKRNVDQINKTIHHEYLHYLINNGYKEHFCGESK